MPRPLGQAARKLQPAFRLSVSWLFCIRAARRMLAINTSVSVGGAGSYDVQLRLRPDRFANRLIHLPVLEHGLCNCRMPCIDKRSIQRNLGSTHPASHVCTIM